VIRIVSERLKNWFVGPLLDSCEPGPSEWLGR
jgi:hypothetical protein